jgi:hypothetical protein
VEAVVVVVVVQSSAARSSVLLYRDETLYNVQPALESTYLIYLSVSLFV